MAISTGGTGLVRGIEEGTEKGNEANACWGRNRQDGDSSVTRDRPLPGSPEIISRIYTPYLASRYSRGILAYYSVPMSGVRTTHVARNTPYNELT